MTKVKKINKQRIIAFVMLCVTVFSTVATLFVVS